MLTPLERGAKARATTARLSKEQPNQKKEKGVQCGGIYRPGNYPCRDVFDASGVWIGRIKRDDRGYWTIDNIKNDACAPMLKQVCVDFNR